MECTPPFPGIIYCAVASKLREVFSDSSLEPSSYVEGAHTANLGDIRALATHFSSTLYCFVWRILVAVAAAHTLSVVLAHVRC